MVTVNFGDLVSLSQSTIPMALINQPPEFNISFVEVFLTVNLMIFTVKFKSTKLKYYYNVLGNLIP